MRSIARGAREGRRVASPHEDARPHRRDDVALDGRVLPRRQRAGRGAPRRIGVGADGPLVGGLRRAPAPQRRGGVARVAATLTDVAKRIEGAGAECVMLCANTPHAVADDVQRAVRVPLLHPRRARTRLFTDERARGTSRSSSRLVARGARGASLGVHGDPDPAPRCRLPGADSSTRWRCTSTLPSASRSPRNGARRSPSRARREPAPRRARGVAGRRRARARRGAGAGRPCVALGNRVRRAQRDGEDVERAAR